MDLPLPLRLTVSRGRLGFELYQPVALGPILVTRLGVSLPGLQFPVDLSGGVRVFRHRRGSLEYAELTFPLVDVGKWLERRLREALGGLTRPLSVWPLEQGIGIGIVGARGALAFDLLWAPVEEDARLVVAHARGAGLDGPALSVALQSIDTALGKLGSRSGRVMTVPRLGRTIVRFVLPAVGARAAVASRVICSALESDPDTARLRVDTALATSALSEDAIRAVELADIVRLADDALCRGDLETARSEYVAALERAPRHPEISALIAEIDLRHGGRAEAALALLSEARNPEEAGAVGALLLSRIGATDSAAEALRRSARAEVFAPLTATLWQALSELETEMPAREAALDAAVASCPGLASVRWARFEARVRAGRTDAATADAEHLEASATGSVARHEVLRRAAARFLDFGYQVEAGRLFERALRYVPDDPAACAGLGRALLEVGKVDRAVPLLERAIVLGDARGEPEDGALIELGRALAKKGNLPEAIARVRRVRAPSRWVVESRSLEGQWRAEIGDLTGASLAFARMREAVELATGVEVDAQGWAARLQTAADFELESKDDAPAAERHLSVALRLLPGNKAIAERYRECAALVQGRSRKA